MDGEYEPTDGCISGLRLTSAEMFALCLARLWTLARECPAADAMLCSGFVRGEIDPASVEEFESLLLILSAASRPLRIADLHAGFVTDDEIALLSLIASAQHGDLDATLAALRRWLPPAGVRIAVRATMRFARSLLRRRLVLRPAVGILNGLPVETDRRDMTLACGVMH